MNTQYMNRILLVLVLVMSIGVRGYGQTTTTFNLRSAANIKAAPGEPKRFYHSGSTTIENQATHEQEQIIYIAEGENKTLHIPTTKVQAYQRWFRYEKEDVLPAGFTANTAARTLSPSHRGIVKTNGMGNRPTVSHATCRMKFACDLSTSAMGDNGQEPLLAYRMIYDIRDANEMAAKLNKSSMEEPLEYYEMMAPINRQLLIGPKYPFYSGRVYGGSVDYDIRFESNYYISINNNISTSLKRVTYKESSSSYDEFTWFSPEERCCT